MNLDEAPQPGWGVALWIDCDRVDALWAKRDAAGVTILKSPFDGYRITANYLIIAQPRDRKIADRVTSLYQDALAEDECVRPESLNQFRDFFLEHSDIGLPKITLTPDGTLRARWIHGPGSFVAIEFVGGQLVKLVAETPRADGVVARYFGSESVRNLLSVVSDIGALQRHRPPRRAHFGYTHPWRPTRDVC